MSNQNQTTKPQTWKELMATGELILLPSAHDGLTAKIIEQAGFLASQIGGFSVVGALRLHRH